MTRLIVLSIASSVLFAAGPALAQPAEPPESDDPGGGDETTAAPNDEAAEPGADAAEPAGETGAAATTEEPAAAVPDVDALRRRYFELRDKLFRSRARAASVATALYSTRIQVKLDYRSARHFTVTRAIVRLDGANVFDDTEGKITSDSAVRFEGYVAPGRHQVTVRIEAAGKDDERITTATETTLAVIAPAGKDLVVEARAADGGDMAYRWQRKESGSYRLRLDVDVKSVKREGNRKRGAIKRASR